MERRFSIIFGLVTGAMWMGEVILGNLGGTSVFGDLRDFHPRVYGFAPIFALCAVGVTAASGFLAAYRTRRVG